tara:strand:- start:199 stop:399 length:201 start_codon:yes stop_codon:yes gene_type:complete
MKQVVDIFQAAVGFEGYEIDGKIIQLCISNDEVSALLQNYDPDDFNSPDIVTCRALARLILDALNS